MHDPQPDSTPSPQTRDPEMIAKIINVAWHVREVLEAWHDPERPPVYDEAWFAEYGRVAEAAP